MNKLGSLEKFSITLDDEIEDLRDLKFNIIDDKDEKFMEVVEDKDQHNWCWKQLCCLSRPFELNVQDTNETKLIEIHRPFKGCFIDFGLHEFNLKSPSENGVGSIHQRFSLLPGMAATFEVRDEGGATIFTVKKKKKSGYKIEDTNEVMATIKPTTDEDEESGCQVCSKFSSPLPTIKVKFSVEMDVSKKQLVLASALFVYITEIDRQTDTISKDKGRCCCFCYWSCVCFKASMKVLKKLKKIIGEGEEGGDDEDE